MPTTEEIKNALAGVFRDFGWFLKSWHRKVARDAYDIIAFRQVALDGLGKDYRQACVEVTQERNRVLSKTRKLAVLVQAFKKLRAENKELKAERDRLLNLVQHARSVVISLEGAFTGHIDISKGNTGWESSSSLDLPPF